MQVITTLAALAGVLSVTSAHTWVERLNVIAPNGTMINPPGFPRANVLRTAPNFNDNAMVNLIPPNGGPINVIDPNTLMCKKEQTTQTQSDGSPRLKAGPGASVALRYQENGHVTLPQNQPGKPDNRGTNFVYFTTQSTPEDKFLQIHRQWTTDGQGGDGRGKLISTSNFDDSQCYQVNGQQISTARQQTFKHQADQLQGADLWCQQDIQIPADAQAGSTVTLYWVWDWPTMPGTPGFPQGKQEIYTTCMDIDIVAPSGNTNAKAVVQFQQQDFGNAAVAAQFRDIANPSAVASPQLIPFSSVTSNTATPPVSTTTPLPRAASSSSTPREQTVTEYITVTDTTSKMSVVTVYDTETTLVTVSRPASSTTSASSIAS